MSHWRRSEIERLERELATLPVRPLQRLDELEAERRAVTQRRELHPEQLDALPPPSRRLGRVTDSHAEQRAYAREVLEMDDRAPGELQADCQEPIATIGDVGEMRHGWKTRGQTLARLQRQYEQVRDRVADRELATSPAWAIGALGDQPATGRARDVWNLAAQQIARYRIDHDLADESSALVETPSALH